MFKLNEKINNDTFEVCDLSLCKVLLMNDANYPWLILVPQVAEITELHHLSMTQQEAVLKDINLASRVMEQIFEPTSLNVAALGNVVRQLHIHVIARFEDDATWPGPVWGQKEAIPYTDSSRLELLKDTFGQLQIQP